METLTLVGNLVADPELRYTPSGKAVANFRLAVTLRVNEGGKWKDGETEFHDVVAWQNLAETAATAFIKGQRVIVVGRPTKREWEHEGEKRSKVEITAEDLGPSIKFIQPEQMRGLIHAEG